MNHVPARHARLAVRMLPDGAVASLEMSEFGADRSQMI
jgi:hypothetical protein